MTHTALTLAFAFCGVMGLMNPAKACDAMCLTCDQTQPPKPAICAMQPFTADTQYMSMQGYLRWQHFQVSANWLDHQQAVAMTEEETRICKAQF
jgi:hypothetical protein